ncbi:MAG: efflux RND transporter periplasmic adaptor subunit [Cytophagales bacterium]
MEEKHRLDEKTELIFMRTIWITLITFLLLGCTKKQAADMPSEGLPDAAQVKITEQQFKKLGIELGKPTARIISGVIKATGMLDVPPQNLVSISAPLGGFVKKTELLQGMRVKKGQTIVELEHPDYIQLQEDYLMTKNQLEYLELEFKRQEELANEKVSAAKDFQMAKSNYQSSKTKLSGLKAKLNLINIRPSEIESGAIKSTISIVSPISGFVSQVNVNIGMYVSPSTLMFRIVDTDHLHAEVQVFEKDLPKLKIGQRVFLQLANENAEREADVYLIGKEITPERTVRVHCHLRSEDPQLIPGLFFSARIETEKSNVDALPADAVLLFEGKHFVFLEKQPLVFEFVEVEKGITENGFTQVTIPATEQSKQVVVRGAYFLLGILKNGGDEE